MVSDEQVDLVKLLLSGRDGEIETPWAERVSHRLFRLDNLPFYAYGVSVDDVVEAEATEHEGVFRFIRVHEPSGNRTVRVVFEDGRSNSDADAQSLLEALLGMGCSYEGANRHYLVVTIPKATDLGAVTSKFDTVDLRWEYANPTYDEINRP